MDAPVADVYKATNDFVLLHTRRGKTDLKIWLPCWWFEQMESVARQYSRMGFPMVGKDGGLLFRGAQLFPTSDVDEPTLWED